MDGLLEGNAEKARQMLREAGYDGAPIVLLQSSDVAELTNLAPVAKGLLERAGFKVDMQTMDWQTMVNRLTQQCRDATSTTAGEGVLGPDQKVAARRSYQQNTAGRPSR